MKKFKNNNQIKDRWKRLSRDTLQVGDDLMERLTIIEPSLISLKYEQNE